jgi:hypothetical protein
VRGARQGLAAITRVLERLDRDDPAEPGHWLGRFLMLRLLGVVYLMAFLTLVFQGPALIGPRGLLPATSFLERVAAHAGSRLSGFSLLPSLFWLGASDGMLRAAGCVGVALALALCAGYANALTLAALCVLQISIEAVGQTFYAFGWEIQLVETGVLCIFLCPLVDPRPWPRRAPPALVVWSLRWLAMRIMWGAGLIKLRGDPCWRDLTCLDFYFETQPVPNPLSPLFHALPGGVHQVGVLFNHAVELVAPFGILGPRRARIAAGIAMLALQLILIASGNLSFLNWLTIVPILACFDDGVWRRLLPRALVARAEAARAAAQATGAPDATRVGRARKVVVACLGLVVVVLSVAPAVNMLSGSQIMNASFTRIPLVNTYGAFGTVARERHQLVFEGTTDETITSHTTWMPYQFECQPGDPARRPCWMSPYHYRLDWLLWFAAMDEPGRYPWAVHLVWKLLAADRETLGLIASDPFHGTRPRHVRVEKYVYKFAPRGARVWWTREHRGSWLPPLARDDAAIARYMRARGWDDDGDWPPGAPAAR